MINLIMSHGSIKHDMHDMIGNAFACRESINDSLGPNEETKKFFKLIEDAGHPSIWVVKSLVNSHLLLRCIILNACIMSVTGHLMHLQNSSKGLFQKI